MQLFYSSPSTWLSLIAAIVMLIACGLMLWATYDVKSKRLYLSAAVFGVFALALAALAVYQVTARADYLATVRDRPAGENYPSVWALVALGVLVLVVFAATLYQLIKHQAVALLIMAFVLAATLTVFGDTAELYFRHPQWADSVSNNMRFITAAGWVLASVVIIAACLLAFIKYEYPKLTAAGDALQISEPEREDDVQTRHQPAVEDSGAHGATVATRA
ncbi:MAG: hypothetical protein K0S68_999 [Candidatus Saccharibacteria bacterium]|nr:hypothetical protein [Candidatus Saccharibacteria bacterium]